MPEALLGTCRGKPEPRSSRWERLRCQWIEEVMWCLVRSVRFAVFVVVGCVFGCACCFCGCVSCSFAVLVCVCAVCVVFCVVLLWLGPLCILAMLWLLEVNLGGFGHQKCRSWGHFGRPWDQVGGPGNELEELRPKLGIFYPTWAALEPNLGGLESQHRGSWGQLGRSWG